MSNDELADAGYPRCSAIH